MDLSRICETRAPMDVRCRPMTDAEGRDVLLVVAKMTWAVSPRGQAQLAFPIAPVQFFDRWRTETSRDAPGRRFESLVRASDAVEIKPGTEVILVGTAYPSHPEATEQEVSLRIETGRSSLQKSLTVTGPRVWVPTLRGMAPGPAGRMEPTPIVYELAYGGYDDSADPMVMEPRNPAGTGFLERRKGLYGKPAPVIEDKRAPLSSSSPAPAGFGPIPTHWSPRREMGGTHDDAWRRERAPLRPLDFDPRHHLCAPPDQWLQTPLLGDEAVEVLGATREGAWRFRLPRFAPEFNVTVRGETAVIDTHLDTFLIDADAGRVELSWRIAVPFPRKAEMLEKVLVYGVPPLPDSMVTDLAARVYGGGHVEDS